MCLDDLLTNAYLTDEALGASEIPIVLAGCATNATSSLVVSKADFEEVLVSARSASPAIASVILNLGTEKEPGAELWLIMLRNPSVKKKYEELRREQVEKQLNEAVPSMATVPETIEEAEALLEKVEPVMEELLGEEEEPAPTEESAEESLGVEEANSLLQAELEVVADREVKKEREETEMNATIAESATTGFGTLPVPDMSGFDGVPTPDAKDIGDAMAVPFGVDGDFDESAVVAESAAGVEAATEMDTSTAEMDVPVVEAAAVAEVVTAPSVEMDVQETAGFKELVNEESQELPAPEAATNEREPKEPTMEEEAPAAAEEEAPEAAEEASAVAKAMEDFPPNKILMSARAVMKDFANVWDCVGASVLLRSNNVTPAQFRETLLSAVSGYNEKAETDWFPMGAACADGIEGIAQLLGGYESALELLAEREDVDTIQAMLDPIMSLIYGEE